MRRIIYEANGGVVVVYPVRNSNEKMTDAEVERRAWAALPPEAVNPRFADDAEIPKDRTYRNAWVMSGGKIAHDMGKCRSLHRDRLRVLRKPRLAALDVQFMRALEIGADVSEIVALKQALRDAPADPAIDAASTPEELKNSIPKALA